MGVSKNRGTPKWMLYYGKPYIKMDDLGMPLFLKTPMYGWIELLNHLCHRRHHHASCQALPVAMSAFLAPCQAWVFRWGESATCTFLLGFWIWCFLSRWVNLSDFGCSIPKSWFSGKILSFFGWFFEGWWFRMIPTHAVVLEKTFGGIGWFGNDGRNVFVYS